jgi:hypothetical protein
VHEFPSFISHVISFQFKQRLFIYLFIFPRGLHLKTKKVFLEKDIKLFEMKTKNLLLLFFYLLS